MTEYVLTAGDPYERMAGFAKRLRAQAHSAGARRGEAFAATVLGETELFTGNRGPWPAAVAQARADLLLAEGNRRAAADALRRAAEGFAAAGQLLGERRARKRSNASLAAKPAPRRPRLA